MSMEMNRRGFFGAIAAGLVLDPDRLLWTPKRYVQGVTLAPAYPSGTWFTGHLTFHYKNPSGGLEMWPTPRNDEELAAAVRQWNDMIASYNRGDWVKVIG